MRSAFSLERIPFLVEGHLRTRAIRDHPRYEDLDVFVRRMTALGRPCLRSGIPNERVSHWSPRCHDGDGSGRGRSGNGVATVDDRVLSSRGEVSARDWLFR